MDHCKRTSLVINAGGGSRRMGENKALLPLPPDGRPLLAHMLARLMPLGFAAVVVVANDARLAQRMGALYPVRYVADRYPGAGALGGIATGLAYADGWALILACDMPLVHPPLLTWLCDLAQAPPLPGRPPWDAIVPHVGGRLQPLHALYHPRALPVLEQAVARQDLRVTDALAALHVQQVPEAQIATLNPTLHSFFNANTPQDWATALRLLAEETQAG